MISDKYKCIHIHIPKCAGTSIDYALHGTVNVIWDEDKKVWVQHLTALEAKKYYASEEQWNDYFKFAIVRNPFDKLVSSYNWLCRCFKPCDFRDRLLFKDFIFRKGAFKNLLNPNLIIKKENKYVQIKSSVDFTMDGNDELMIDHVGRFENLKEEWDFICKQLGVKIKLGHRNKHGRDNKHYRDYYNDETREFVTSACKKDLEIFGYEF
jgi:hypothetical protein